MALALRAVAVDGLDREGGAPREVARQLLGGDLGRDEDEDGALLQKVLQPRREHRRAAHWRAHALCLQQDADAALAGGFGDVAGGSDALEADAPPEGAGRASLVSASGPTATLVRAWANVLLAPAACWSVLLDALCDARGEALHQRRTTLVVFDDPDRAAAPDAPPSAPADSEARDQADAPAPPALPASLLARAAGVLVAAGTPAAQYRACDQYGDALGDLAQQWLEGEPVVRAPRKAKKGRR